MAATGLQSLTDEQVARKIGKLTSADYIVFGAVTQYHFENTNMQIPYKIDNVAYDEYLEKLKEYKRQAVIADQEYQSYLINYNAYLEKALLRKVYYNDINGQIHFKDNNGRRVWSYKSFSNIDYSSFAPMKFIQPIVGKNSKELQHNNFILVENKKQKLNELEKVIESHESSVSSSHWKKAVAKVDGSWRNQIKNNKDDSYITNTKRLIRKVVDRLKEINEIDREISRQSLEPIPEFLNDFNLPDEVSRFVSVANLGITFKLIDVKTGEIVWIGQASKRDSNIQAGLNNMVEKVVQKITITN